MPKKYTKKYTKKNGRRAQRARYNSRSLFGGSTGTAISGPSTSPVPKRMVAKLRYCDNLQLNPTTGSLAVHRFCANGIYDPDQSGVGHQPMGHDQWSAFYERYTVIGSKMTATFSNQASGGTANTICGIAITENSSFTPSLTELRERGNTAWTYVGSAGSGDAIKQVSKACSPKRWKGVKNLLTEEDYSGLCTTSNPSEQLHYQVFVAAQDSAIDPAVHDVSIMIEYTVVYHTPIQVNGS